MKQEYLMELFPHLLLSPEEDEQSKILTPLQRLQLINQARELVREIAGMTYTKDKNDADYGVKLSYQQGQLDSIMYQIEVSDITVKEIQNRIQAQSQSSEAPVIQEEPQYF